MAPARLLILQKRMRERDLGALGNGLERDLDARLVRVFFAALPTPAHYDPFGSYDIEKFAAAFVLAAVEFAEAHAVAATLARIGFRNQHRPRIRTPPLRNTLRSRHRVEHDRGPRLDSAHKSQARHAPLLRNSASVRSA